MKKKLLISFSGGRTSGYMLKWIWDNRREDFEIVVVFANTGKEVEGTYRFVQACSDNWGIPIVWIESRHLDDNGNRYSKHARRVSYRIVDFKTASRNGEPYEEMISVLGIPSTNAPLCSDQLKVKPSHEYVKSLGWKKYIKAVGIRYDEPDRLKPSTGNFPSLWYPLSDETVMSKWDILNWWAFQEFDLEIEPEDGNCDRCWKKNKKLLVNGARKRPESFDWWQLMTDRYGHMNPRNTNLKPPFNFYRGNLSPKDFLELAKMPPETINQLSLLDPPSSCSESCEAF